jgi:hypothetical protein
MADFNSYIEYLRTKSHKEEISFEDGHLTN